jgi:hypothetical protein
MYNTKQNLLSTVINWVNVDNRKGNHVYGHMHNKPIAKGILFGDRANINLTKVIEVLH